MIKKQAVTSETGKQVSLFAAVSVVIANMVGTGVFGSPGFLVVML